MTLHEEVKQLIAEGKIKEIFQNFSHPELTFQQGRFNTNEKENTLGIVSSQDYRLEKNKIAVALLSLEAGEWRRKNSVTVIDNSTTVIVIGNVPTTQSEYTSWIDKQAVADIFTAVLKQESLPEQLRDEIEDMQTAWNRKVRKGENTPTATTQTKEEILEKFNTYLSSLNAKKGAEETKLMKIVTDAITSTTNWDGIGKTLVHFKIANSKLGLGFENRLESIKWIPTSGTKDEELLKDMRSEGMIGDDEVQEALRRLNVLVGEAWAVLEKRGIRRS